MKTESKHKESKVLEPY